MDEEKYGKRDLTYSAWHRTASTGRFVGADSARLLAMIDVDHVLWIEYEDKTKEPLALIEEAKDVGQAHKSGKVTRNLARRAGLPAMVVLWKESDKQNPASPEHKDISSFRVKRLWPTPEGKWREITPKEWATALLRMRTWLGEKFDEWLFGKKST
jgi:hypothetical protein